MENHSTLLMSKGDIEVSIKFTDYLKLLTKMNIYILGLMQKNPTLKLGNMKILNFTFMSMMIILFK